jgi:gluconate 5-dehydrogenase
MTNPFDLSGKLALITGGGIGLGLGMAHAIIQAGGKVVITGRRADKLKEACDGLGSSSSYIQHDINELDSIPGLVDEVESRFGPIEILINNAGNHLKKNALETSDDGLAEVLQTHVQGGFGLARECARRMIPRKSGSILFISSMSAIMGIPNVVAYSAAKTAVAGMVRALASEWSPHGVRVNSITPGWIKSDMTEKALDSDPPRKQKIMSRIYMGHMGSSEDIGWAAVYLSSPAARYVTGLDLRIDGGAGYAF